MRQKEKKEGRKGRREEGKKRKTDRGGEGGVLRHLKDKLTGWFHILFPWFILEKNW